MRKTVRDVEKLAAKVPGGAPDSPIDVASSSVVELCARDIPCIQCGGQLEVRGDRATSTPRGVLREMEMVCRQCHAPRRLWFRVAVGAN
jgi:hypothetical protein